jgi:uridine kinase
MREVTIMVEGKAAEKQPAGIRVRDVLPEKAANGLAVIGAMANNEVVSLNYALVVNTVLAPLTIADRHGWRIYRWSLGLLLAAAVRRAETGIKLRIRHSLGNGLYCTAEWPAAEAVHPLAVRVARLEAAMRELVARDMPIESELVSYDDALSLFETSDRKDARTLLLHRNPPHVPLVRCDDFLDLEHGPLAHRTGLLNLFRLVPCDPGFVLDMASSEAPDRIAPFEPQPHLFHIYQEHIAWGRILGITTVGQLNECITAGDIDDIILTAEALHEKKLAAIATSIASHKPTIRLVLAAGPSSAGKTTFAKRLVSHLRVNGLHPVMISTDDYFVGDNENPRDEQGNLDYEHIEAVDLQRLNRDLLDLFEGRTVHLRAFDFHTKGGRDRPELTRLGPQDVIVMEGIHSLNPRLTDAVPRNLKFQIYVSALTQLGVDCHNRVSTTDNRLIRRMVRDFQYRGYSALTTLRRWQSVRHGEHQWIFPFQHLSDATFNSALDYELAVLKTFAIPLLNEIKPHHAEYAEARRLSGFLHNFLAIPPTTVPGNSILREYIGGSQLKY